MGRLKIFKNSTVDSGAVQTKIKKAGFSRPLKLMMMASGAMHMTML